MIYIANIYDAAQLRDKVDVSYAIVRNYKRKIPGIQLLEDLAPSAALYSAYYKKLREGKWSKEEFENWYKPRFLKEMKSFGAQVALDKLVEGSNRGVNYCLSCYCRTSDTCHRSLVADLLREKGAQVEEITPNVSVRSDTSRNV